MVEWRAIPEWEGYYEASDDGQVRSIDRRVKVRNHHRRYPGRLLKQTPDDKNYWRVTLKRGRSVPRKSMQVHQAVLLAFVGPPEPGQVCRHLDGNQDHNHVSNLKWGTRSENCFDTVAHGRNEKANRTHCPLDHVLAEPNLTLGSFRRGLRSCLACHRAGARLAYAKRMDKTIDFAAVADVYYRAIMAGDAPVTSRRGPAPGWRGAPAQRGAEPSRDRAASGGVTA